MRNRTRLCTSLLLLLLVSASNIVRANVITVRQDGTGDYTTLSAAIGAAASGDVLEIGPGTWSEGASLAVTIPLSLVSTDGAAATRLDGGDTHRLLEVSTGPVSISGLTFQNGNAVVQGVAGALVASVGAHLTLEDCRFDGNDAQFGGAIYVSDSNTGVGTTLFARRCAFTFNSAVQAGGAIAVVAGAVATIEDGTFVDNTTGIKGGAIWSYLSTTDCSGSLFLRNRSGDVAGALYHDTGGGTIERNTFVDNDSPGPISGTVTIVDSPGSVIHRNVIVGEQSGYGLRLYLSPTSVHTCNVYWGNLQAPIGGDVLHGTEADTDPFFCDAGAEDFSLASNSPAAAANSLCGDLVGAFPVGCGDFTPGVPLITRIEDVPNDNGWQVRIEWERSSYDAPGAPVITGYGVYRREDPSGAGVAPRVLKGGDPQTPRIDLEGWDFVASVPARGDDVYQTVAPTVCNQTRGGPPEGRDCYSVFFVSAMTADPLTFFDSEPDSGFSTDDIAPAAPAGLHAGPVAAGVELRWTVPDDDDLAGFRVYRGAGGDFEMSAASLVRESTTPHWVDTSSEAMGASYKVTAVDAAGNESRAAFIATRETTARNHVALYQNTPNPFNPSTEIFYDVPPGGADIRLIVYDTAGRRVATLRDGFESSGLRKSVVWNGQTDKGERAASGVYYYRLLSPGFERTFRMVLVQ